jgi:hypothetical protein
VTQALPAPIQQEAAALLHRFKRSGYRPLASGYSAESFGNWFVELHGPAGALRLLKDRDFFSLEGDRSVLEPAGLWLFASRDLAVFSTKVEDALSAGKLQLPK